MPTFLESLGEAPQSVVPTTVLEPVKPLQAPPPASDEFAAFEDTSPDEFAAFEDAGPDEFSGFPDADDLDVRSVDELNADRDKFNPKDYYANNPDVASDPAKLAKLLDVYRRRDKEGLDAAQVAKSAATEALPTVGKVLGGLRDLTEGAINVGLQPVANLFGSIATGDIFDKQRRKALVAETRKEQKQGVAQFAAGSELSASSIADLGRQAIRKLPKPTGNMEDATFEEALSGKPRPEKTDQELLQQIAADVEFGNQMAEVAQGKGEAAKAIGLDAETLAKEGIALDPEVIERLSLVDPLTLVAGGGIFKGVTSVGKVAFTATSRAAAEAAIQKISQVAAKAVAAPIRATGKVAELTGAAAKFVAPAAPYIGGVGGAVSGGFAGAGGGVLAGQAVKTGLAKGGALLQSTGRGITKAGEAVGNSVILQKALRGATEGGIAAGAIASATDDDRTAGSILGAGIVLGGGIRGTIGAAEAPALAISKARLAPREIAYPETRSPGYGHDRTLDAAHETAIKTLPQPEQNQINSFRETARKLNSEAYFLDDVTFAEAVQSEAARTLGRELTGQEKVDLGRVADADGFYDTGITTPDGTKRRVLYLRKSANAMTHEVGHLFKTMLSPERQAELIQSARDSYTPEQIAEIQADQGRRLGKPVTEAYALEEIIADNFSQLFRNTPVSELTTPPTLLQKIGRTVTDFAEQLGLDLTAGERTASAGAASSLRFNDVVRDAAREILAPQPRQPVKPPEPVTLTQAGQKLGPLVEPRFGKRSATPEAVNETRKIVNEAPDTTLPGAAMSQKEILGTVADIIASEEGARYVYRQAEGSPGADVEAKRVTRRAEIEQARNMPESVRRLVEKTGHPYRIAKTKNGVIQILDVAPDMYANNALRVAKALSELAVKDPTNPVLEKVKYGLDVQKGEWTEQGWVDLFKDAETFAANQGKGFAGSGIALDFPPEVVAAGRRAPKITGTPVALDQSIADFQNMLYNLRVPKTARQGKGPPGNLIAQAISKATLPGRLKTPALVEPRKIGETGVRAKFKGGEEILDPNPLRAEFETALQAQNIPLPDGIEVVRVLNLEHIADVVAEPNLPRTVGKVPVVAEAGFQAATARGRATEELGFEIRHTGGPANPGISIFKDGTPVGDISAVRKSPVEADIDSIKVNKEFRGQGLSEILYREIGKRLQDEGVENVTGMIVNPRALTSRTKVFPETRIENEIQSRGGFDTAFEVRSKISPEARFSPVELADRVEKFTPSEFRDWVASINHNFTQAAYDVGLAAPDRAFVESLKQRYDMLSQRFNDSLTSIRNAAPEQKLGMLNDMSALANQGQFFREAHEAATGTGSAGERLRSKDPNYKPPFPLEEVSVQARFAPETTVTGKTKKTGGGTAIPTMPQSEVEKIADAIYIAEGGAKASKPYGILSVKVKDEAEARRVAINTIKNNWKRWHDAGRPGDYLEFLAKRYAPLNVKNDPKGLNKNWLKNVRSHLNK